MSGMSCSLEAGTAVKTRRRSRHMPSAGGQQHQRFVLPGLPSLLVENSHRGGTCTWHRNYFTTSVGIGPSTTYSTSHLKMLEPSELIPAAAPPLQTPSLLEPIDADPMPYVKCTVSERICALILQQLNQSRKT
eukprot:TRINITY_DN111777_c0_g1_i1.p1 TRINITY_DN111777_c0_g1~~TRINITY_DN111777_c0_g1_i1.p1  ORF type:complete len:133 (-),score=2.92 TRINITY_DN111777_c0_g1_i1:30-428(-)